MSKISSAFGGGAKSSKPSTTEIFLALADKARLDEEEKKNKLGGPGLNASLSKFEKGRKVKARRLKGGRIGVGGAAGPGDEEQAAIKRPGARTATLLGN